LVVDMARMGIGTYFIGLVISGLAALLVRVPIRWLIKRASCGPFLSAVLRALPFALAFAPTLLMKRGLGVLIPAALYLFPALTTLPFQTRPMDADDWGNLRLAATSFVLVWGISAFILFARQSFAVERKGEPEK